MREMFDGVVEPSSFRVGPKRRPTPQITLLVVCGTTLMLASIEAGQILATADLPVTPRSLIAFMPTLPVADIDLPAPPRQTTPRVREQNGQSIGDATSSPLAPPDGVNQERAQATPLLPAPAGDVVWRKSLLPGAVSVEALPPLAPVPAAPSAREIPRVGGELRAPSRIRSVSPSYPPLARSAQVQGVVIIEATINANGKVVDARILRSIPLLDAAALDAVRQWEFTPPLLNGLPTPVIMTVTVNFTLR